jgi:hypothetical protein
MGNKREKRNNENNEGRKMNQRFYAKKVTRMQVAVGQRSILGTNHQQS